MGASRQPTHDPDLAIGTWFANRDTQVHTGKGLAWDAFILFDADATQLTGPILESGHPIYVRRLHLQRALQ